VWKQALDFHSLGATKLSSVLVPGWDSDVPGRMFTLGCDVLDRRHLHHRAMIPLPPRLCRCFERAGYVPAACELRKWRSGAIQPIGDPAVVTTLGYESDATHGESRGPLLYCPMPDSAQLYPCSDCMALIGAGRTVRPHLYLQPYVDQR
jgi:hypothetical protein